MAKKGVSLSLGRGEKSKKGGLTAKGRRKYNRATGSNLKAPQPQGGARKRSFCARMKGVKGPMKKPNGKPTRKALALRRWKRKWHTKKDQSVAVNTEAKRSNG